MELEKVSFFGRAALYVKPWCKHFGFERECRKVKKIVLTIVFGLSNE